MVFVGVGSIAVALYFLLRSAELRSPPTAALPASATAAAPDMAAPPVVPPCAQGQEAERPLTGHRVEPDAGVGGHSQLEISNGTRYDAAVRLLDIFHRTARFVYVRAGDSYTIGSISQGTYYLRYTTGSDWVAACRSFEGDANYGQFEQYLVFTDAVYDDLGRAEYGATTYKATLNPVPFGNARTKEIDRATFLEGDAP
jgi:hypothetical protein